MEEVTGINIFVITISKKQKKQLVLMMYVGLLNFISFSQSL